MLDKIIQYSFYLLFFLTPLFWTPVNYELFEFNKMLLVYFLTIVIVLTWILKMINQKTLILNRTPLDIPLLLFLGANILSTIFSIDTHTSIWGYYSRSNGGLLSIVSYLLLYWAFVSNMDAPKVLNTLKFGLVSGLIISLWGIAEHFGVSPSCVILRGEFNASCWIQDVQSRVFATLGQPNWLAAYLAMLIFPSLYFFLTAKNRILQTTYYLLLVTSYLAFTFTYSRGPILGLITGMIVFLILSFPRRSSTVGMTKRVLIVLATFFLINLLFGSALTNFRLVSKFAPPPRPAISLPTPASTVTQLEQGGTESGQIRLIVWKGALEIFKHFPIFGSGVETFAISYFQFRPQAHNLVSEWDFLYNKAHNEFLNYLANTGLVGLGTYLIIIITFIIIILKRKGTDHLLLLSLLASYLSYHVTNFFGFSVVATALLFYLFPALAFVATESTKALKLSTVNWIYRRPLYTKLAKGVVIFLTLYLLYFIIKLWYADNLFAKGMKESETGNVGSSYNFLLSASILNSNEPFYRSELSFAAASAALSLSPGEATLSTKLKDQATQESEKVLKSSPKNVSFWRTAIRTYFQLSALDESFFPKTMAALDQTIKLAPTDAKLYYNKAILLGQKNDNEDAKEALKKAIELKPNYRESYLALGIFYFDEGKSKEAVETMQKVLTLVPGDADALNQLNEWGKQGIATQSGQ